MRKQNVNGKHAEKDRNEVVAKGKTYELLEHLDFVAKGLEKNVWEDFIVRLLFHTLPYHTVTRAHTIITGSPGEEIGRQYILLLVLFTQGLRLDQDEHNFSYLMFSFLEGALSSYQQPIFLQRLRFCFFASSSLCLLFPCPSFILFATAFFLQRWYWRWSWVFFLFFVLFF